MQNGKIGVTTENIFPIIKKFLYSDHEIFLRELIANAIDATQKIKTLSSIGEFKGELGDLTVNVNLDTEKRLLTISDSGIGMTGEEIEKYINQIAFSGAEEFMEKYKNQAIIGHFGLGFYSAFMVADKVEIITHSYKHGAKTMHWTCDGSPEYTLTESETKRERGTDIILHISEDSKEFAEHLRIKDILKKHCSFLPIPIAFGKAKEWKDGKYVDTDRDDIINNTEPLWIRKPADITDEDYKKFYQELYPMAEEPLFHIHLNIDYPFNLTGILYFPRLRNNIEVQKNKIQLYCNQVFVTDSVEGIVPEFLTLLHGVIDSPDIPLNVSRSYLQSDSNVKKISSYITRKVADRLAEIFAAERAEYESKWDHLKVFIQYGIVTDEKFAEKATEFTLLKNTENKYYTLAEYETAIGENQKDRNGNLIYLYATDVVSQFGYIEAAKDKGYDVLVMNGPLDNHFISWFEHKNQGSRFTRVDADVIDKLIEKDTDLKMSLSTQQQDILRPVFESQLPSEQKVNYTVSFEPMADNQSPVLITQNEFMRRMKDMSAMGGGGMAQFYGEMPDSFNVVINGNHPLVIDILEQVETAYGDKLKSINKKITAATNEKSSLDQMLAGKKAEEIAQDEKDMQKELNEKVEQLNKERTTRLSEIGKENNLVKQIVDLALLSSGMLKGENLNKFIRRSVELIGK